MRVLESGNRYGGAGACRLQPYVTRLTSHFSLTLSKGDNGVIYPFFRSAEFPRLSTESRPTEWLSKSCKVLVFHSTVK